MRFVIYTRKSSEQEERQILSIEAQLRELEEYAAKEQLQIVASLCEARTARETGRTVFGEMLGLIERGEADGILAWHPDRLARNAVDGGRIIHLLDCGKLKDLRFPTMTFDNSPNGKFMLQIAFGQSKYYTDALSENVKRGIRQKMKRGEWSWKAPTGYLNNPHTRNIDIDPEKAPVIREAFRLYATGNYTLDAIKAFLIEKGFRSRLNKTMGKAAVQVLLQNPIFCGLMRVNGELHEGSFKPLISKELFDKCQAVMSDRAKPRKGTKNNFPFTGWLKCAHCGCAITCQKQKGHHYYHCTKKKGPCSTKHYLREEKILEQARKIVEELSLPDDWADNMLSELSKRETESKSDNRAVVQHLRSEKRALEKKLEDLLDLRLEGAISNDEYLAKKNKLVSEKVNLDQKIARAERNHCEWLEPCRQMILRSREAKSLLHTENLREIPTFLKQAGSNWALKEAAVQWQAQKGWRKVRQRCERLGWWTILDSNQ
ncbi:MAG: recombinase family protein [Candidatus Peribacteraceae bacterium]|nr:recombinase family protein [Candidatus Peribacteraceae bacterium]